MHIKLFELKIFKTLAARVIFILSISTFFVVGSLILYNSIAEYQTAKSNTHEHLSTLANEKANLIKNDFEGSLLVARTLSVALLSYEKIPETERRNYYNTLLQNTLLNNSTFLATWIMCEPNAIDNRDSLFKDDNLGLAGLFISTYYKENSVVKAEDRESNDETELLYDEFYTLPKFSRKEVINNPYFYKYNNITGNEVFETSLVVPVIRNNRFLGVAGVDLNFDKIQVIVSGFKPYYTGYSFVVSNDGTIASHPNKRFLGKKIQEILPGPESDFSISRLISSGIAKTFETKLEDGVNYVFTLAPIQVGETETPWSFVIIVPAPQTLKQAKTNLYTSVIIGFIGILTLIGFTFFASVKITRPMKIIIDSLNKMAVGGFPEKESEALQKFTSNEFRLITTSLKKLIHSQKQTALFAKEIEKGNLNQEFNVLGEEDILGNSLLLMQKSLVETQNKELERKNFEARMSWITEGLAKFADILRKRTDNLEELAYEVISELVRYTGATQGGLFTYVNEDADDIHLNLIAVFAFDKKRYETRKISVHDGLAGTCAQEKKTIFITKVPHNYVNIVSGIGAGKPGCLLIVPLISNETVFGVVELASFEVFQKHHIEFVEKIAESIATTISSISINIQTANLLAQSRLQSDEMIKKEKELTENIVKMQEVQDNMRKRESEMKSLIDALNMSQLYAEFNLDGNIISINNNYCEILKLTKNEALKLNQIQLFQIKPYDIEQNEQFWSDIIAGNVKPYESQIFVEKQMYWLSGTFAPVFDENGKVYKILNISRDITRRKQNEEDIKKLLSETQEKAEQLTVQEMEMENTLEEMVRMQNVINEKEEEIQILNDKLALNEQKNANLLNEMEKRINKLKQNEVQLRKQLAEEQQNIGDNKAKKKKNK